MLLWTIYFSFLVIPDHLLQKRVLLVLFEQQIACIQALLQVPFAQFMRHSHIHFHIIGVFEVRHNASVRHTKNFLDFSDY